ncbi:MAG TPA: MFS transporter, partial [Bryobacteraceae bacterium]|nr:MFS transporter [Bryobacteraceae bacterium]
MASKLSPYTLPDEVLPEVALQARRKIARRVLPFIFLLYIVAYLDRANVAYAGLPMRAALGFSEAVFGFGAGVFFIGYFLLEIPGALIVERWSARRWLARILVTWGICTCLVGLVRTPLKFYGARFLLGAAEAGFFPGIIVYLTHWFRAGDRARAMAGFVIAAPVALAFGAPLAALILRMNALGLPGWRWVFILEGIPAVVLGVMTLYYLTDHPRHARWLTPGEREWIAGALAAESRNKAGAGSLAWWRALREPNVLLLTAAHFFACMAGYGFVLWLPNTLSKVLGFGPVAAALLSGLPFAAAIAAALLTGRSADRRGTPRRHAAAAMLCAAAC